MKNMIWKRLIMAVCIVALLMNVPSIDVLADVQLSDESISETALYEEHDNEEDKEIVLSNDDEEPEEFIGGTNSFDDSIQTNELSEFDEEEINEEVIGAVSGPASKPQITYAGQVVDSITYRGVTTNAVYTPYRSGLDTDWTYGCFVLVKNFYSSVYGITVSNLVNTSAVPNANSGYFYETRSPRVGDIVRFNNTVHWALVKSVSGSTITLIQMNAWWNNHTCAQVGCTVDASDTSVSFFTYSGYLPDNTSPTGTLDVNGLLDGRESGNTDYYGNFQVYINGNKVSSHPYSDYYNDNLKPGDTYEIRDIKADPGKIYLGASSISGTIRANETSTVTLKIDSAANLGDDFYAVILNTEIWKPISLNTDTQKITLETEKAVAYQKWRFVRQGDGSYLIMSCFDGKVLEMTDGIRTNGTQLSAPNGDWGGRYQRWYLFRFGGAYMIRSAHYQDEEWVINLSNGSSANGTPINICKRNNSNAQVFSIYYDYDVQLKGVSLIATVNNNEVTFDWDRIYGAVSYNLKIWKDELWEGDAYKIVEDATSGISLSLEEGSYTAYVDAVDYFQYKMSNTVNITIKHVPKDISKCTATLSTTSYTYNGKARKPAVTVKDGDTTLTSGTDYTVSYANNKNAGTATAKVTGTGVYTGEKTATFKINKAAAKLAFESDSLSKTTQDGAFINTLTATTDGALTYESSNDAVAAVDGDGLVTIKGAGTATITVSAAAGKNYKAGSASYTLNVSGISLENATVGGVSLSYGYSGKAYTPTVTVKVDGVTLTKDTDYAVKYENNMNPGTAKITVTGKGKYTGTKTKTFEIVDCVSSVVSGKTYLLIPKNNSKTAVCAVGGKMVNNTKVYITDRGNSESQKFKAVKNSDGTWKFINAKCELALAVQQNSSELGAGLVLYDQTTRPAQNWKLSKKSDNSFAIINSVTGYSIAMSDKSAVKGTTLSMAETASVGLQRFYIVETSAVSAPFDGTKSIRAAKDKNFSVNIASASKAEGANVSLYTYTNSNARKFKIIYSGGGYYRLVNVNSGLCLTIKDNSNADGANIIQSKWKGYSSQRWKITKNSDGTVTITNMLGTVLHLLGNRTVNNTNIHARKAASTTAQKWYLQ